MAENVVVDPITDKDFVPDYARIDLKRSEYRLAIAKLDLEGEVAAIFDCLGVDPKRYTFDFQTMCFVARGEK